jgi:N-acetylglucosamine-6-sulfatase
LRFSRRAAFDTDIHVPLVVAGPGVPAGANVPQVAENIDLASTCTSIADTHISSDGHSLLALLRGNDEPDWRNAGADRAPRPGRRSRACRRSALNGRRH